MTLVIIDSYVTRGRNITAIGFYAVHDSDEFSGEEYVTRYVEVKLNNGDSITVRVHDDVSVDAILAFFEHLDSSGEGVIDLLEWLIEASTHQESYDYRDEPAHYDDAQTR